MEGNGDETSDRNCPHLHHTRRVRRLSVFAYNEWALCPPRPGEHRFVITEQELRDIAKDIQHDAVQGFSQMNKDHLLPAVCKALGLKPREFRQA